MGLRMEDLHTPTVALGPTSTPAQNGATTRQSLLELMKQKDNVQAELSALGSVLESHGVNMNTSLTTFDGYPRPDIDVAQIRTTRARIIRLKNDYKALMARIEVGLHEHHANAAATDAEAASAPTTTTGASASAARSGPQTNGYGAPPAGRIEAPFAKVNSVVPSSPADTAGLKAGDKITKFGDVDWMNHEKLTRVAQAVQANEGREIAVKVLRSAPVGGGSEMLEMRLVPRHNWGGRGMLGCHLLPL